MPTIILGIIPLLIGICFGDIMIYLFGILFIVVGSHNFLVIYQLWKENRKSWIKDIRSRVGIIVFSPIEMDNGSK
jgi:Trk-type K+ transport system membrane component